jgi:hypothetical protein
MTEMMNQVESLNEDAWMFGEESELVEDMIP